MPVPPIKRTFTLTLLFIMQCGRYRYRTQENDAVFARSRGDSAMLLS